MVFIFSFNGDFNKFIGILPINFSGITSWMFECLRALYLGVYNFKGNYRLWCIVKHIICVHMKITATVLTFQWILETPCTIYRDDGFTSIRNVL